MEHSTHCTARFNPHDESTNNPEHIVKFIVQKEQEILPTSTCTFTAHSLCRSKTQTPGRIHKKTTQQKFNESKNTPNKSPKNLNAPENNVQNVIVGADCSQLVNQLIVTLQSSVRPKIQQWAQFALQPLRRTVVIKVLGKTLVR